MLGKQHSQVTVAEEPIRIELRDAIYAEQEAIGVGRLLELLPGEFETNLTFSVLSRFITEDRKASLEYFRARLSEEFTDDAERSRSYYPESGETSEQDHVAILGLRILRELVTI